VLLEVADVELIVGVNEVVLLGLHLEAGEELEEGSFIGVVDQHEPHQMPSLPQLVFDTVVQSEVLQRNLVDKHEICRVEIDGCVPSLVVDVRSGE
jgi:hypothetical protein